MLMSDDDADGGSDEDGGWPLHKDHERRSVMIGGDWTGGFRRPGEDSMHCFTEHGFTLCH